MPMTPAGLKTAIKTEMANQGFDIDNPATNGEGDRYVEALATAIVEYIQANAIAQDTGTSASPAGLWPIF